MSRRAAAALSAKRRTVMLGAGATLLIGLITPPVQAARIVAVRMWPSRAYTRITIEHDTEGMGYTTHLLQDPPRLAVDLDGARLNPALMELTGMTSERDPFVRSVRVGQYQASTVRIVFDLKQDIRPEVFSLPAIAHYQHRLVIDLYPGIEEDPLLSFLASLDKERAIPPSAARAPEMREPGRPAGSVGEPARTPVVSRLVTIALDAGHGGEDPGAIGKFGALEKDVVLSIARRLQSKINEEPNMRAFMTRDGDYFVPLHQRVQRARRVQADLFVSIHADAWISPTARGSSVYALSEKGASSSAARWMANRENSADQIGGINIGHRDQAVAQALLDMSTSAQIRDSLRLGQAVLKEIGGVNALHKPRVEQAGFAVLRAPDIPSILVETAFISNPDEELRLVDDNYQDQMARALVAGIRRYFRASPPLARSRMM